MSIGRVIESIERDAFASCMNPPVEFVPTEDDLNVIQKIHEITDKGFSCEVKRNKDGSLLVYEVSKKKR